MVKIIGKQSILTPLVYCHTPCLFPQGLLRKTVGNTSHDNQMSPRLLPHWSGITNTDWHSWALTAEIHHLSGGSLPGPMPISGLANSHPLTTTKENSPIFSWVWLCPPPIKVIAPFSSWPHLYRTQKIQYRFLLPAADSRVNKGCFPLVWFLSNSFSTM